MIAKFMTKDIEENEVSTQLKSELTHLGVIQLLHSHKMTKIWTPPPHLFAFVRFW